MRDDNTFIALDTRTGETVTLRMRQRKRDDSVWYREEVAKAERGNREHVARYERSFNGIMAKSDDDGGDDVAKARDPGRGHHSLTSALIQHLHDRLDRRREHHGYTKREESKMDTQAELIGIMKDCGGPVALCKSIVDRGRAPCDESELVAALSTRAAEQFNMPGDRAFAKLYEAEESVRRACAIAKAMPFIADLAPVMVGGEDARDLSDESTAIAQLKVLGAQKWPTASAAQQFERALTAPENHALARRAVPIPRPTTSYPFPR